MRAFRDNANAAGASSGHSLFQVAKMNDNMLKLAITVGALWAAYKYGPSEVKGAALGIAGMMVINQIPVVRDGLSVRLVA